MKKIFVCVASGNQNLISQEIKAISKTEAADIFYQNNHLQAITIYGPFRRKSNKTSHDLQSIQFTPETIQAIYNGWEVKGFILKEPEKHAYLTFIKKVDLSTTYLPRNGKSVIPVSDLRILHKNER